ncbi:MAG TPA: aldehyde-activating protein [Gammaproteobacteria bacterium]|nr:aldehyde-activating protein [Gammaproteobacteria bacterium]
MTIFTGRCHCGNLKISFETGHTCANLPVRACQCSFCQAHGAVTATDPNGRVSINVTDATRVRHYRFGFGVTDFLICADCGVFMAAVMQIDSTLYASINTNGLTDHAQLQIPPQPVDYTGETMDERRARRKRHWTPVVFDGTWT